MPQDSNYKHLELPILLEGAAKLGGGGKPNPRTVENKNNRVQHANLLKSKANHLNEYWKQIREQRALAEAPDLPPDIPILLQVDPRIDIDALTNFYDFEIISEQEDGYILVANSDIDFTKFLETVQKFKTDNRGGATAAQIYDLSDSEDQISRLKRILSDDLFAGWSQITDEEMYTVDIGIECSGKMKIPKFPSKGKTTQAKYDVKLAAFYAKADAAYQTWDDVKREREQSLERFIQTYRGAIEGIVDAETKSSYDVPDSFTVRAKITGKGFRDLVLCFPFIFEVSSPDEIFVGRHSIAGEDGEIQITIDPPEQNSPGIVIIDSGIQENHPLLAPAIMQTTSISYVPGTTATDVSDYVNPNGHGTRVAGAILYPESIPQTGNYTVPFKIHNARVLDANNGLSTKLFPPALLKRIVDKFHVNSEEPVKIFNHSIAANRPCNLKHMSSWATAIDDLSFQNDVLFIQAAGNLPSDSTDPIQKGILNHIASGDQYPGYLFAKSSRVANPAQSMQALTVGSVSIAGYVDQDKASFATERNEPSAFTRTGLGIWESIKPDVVEYGGDFVIDNATPANITTPKEICPELVRTTAVIGPSFGKDDVGSSYSAPKVTNIAGEIQRILPDESSLLYRALIAQSAKWPNHTSTCLTTPLEKIRCYGYGIPNKRDALENSDYRVTLFTKGEKKIKAREAQIFRVPIPTSIATQANDQDILIEVCLSYSAQPRRTRRLTKGYFGVWVDWEASKANDTVEKFKKRVLKGDKADKDTDSIAWTIGKITDKHQVDGARRNISSLQKDWAIVKAHQLPTEFCIAVIGHPGWDLRKEAFAKYSLVVSFEAINRDIAIYNDIKVEVEQVTVNDVEVDA